MRSEAEARDLAMHQMAVSAASEAKRDVEKEFEKKLALEEPCKQCDGKGFIFTGRAIGQQLCTDCRGSATQPTAFGQSILDFISKYRRE
jgi:hypothetical protein